MYMVNNILLFADPGSRGSCISSNAASIYDAIDAMEWSGQYSPNIGYTSTNSKAAIDDIANQNIKAWLEFRRRNDYLPLGMRAQQDEIRIQSIATGYNNEIGAIGGNSRPIRIANGTNIQGPRIRSTNAEFQLQRVTNKTTIFAQDNNLDLKESNKHALVPVTDCELRRRKLFYGETTNASNLTYKKGEIDFGAKKRKEKIKTNKLIKELQFLNYNDNNNIQRYNNNNTIKVNAVEIMKNGLNIAAKSRRTPYNRFNNNSKNVNYRPKLKKQKSKSKGRYMNNTPLLATGQKRKNIPKLLYSQKINYFDSMTGNENESIVYKGNISKINNIVHNTINEVEEYDENESINKTVLRSHNAPVNNKSKDNKQKFSKLEKSNFENDNRNSYAHHKKVNNQFGNDIIGELNQSIIDDSYKEGKEGQEGHNSNKTKYPQSKISDMMRTKEYPQSKLLQHISIQDITKNKDNASGKTIIIGILLALVVTAGGLAFHNINQHTSTVYYKTLDSNLSDASVDNISSN